MDLNDLPRDLLFCIASRLDSALDLISLGCTNHAFHQLVFDDAALSDLLWKSLYERDILSRSIHSNTHSVAALIALASSTPCSQAQRNDPSSSLLRVDTPGTRSPSSSSHSSPRTRPANPQNESSSSSSSSSHSGSSSPTHWSLSSPPLPTLTWINRFKIAHQISRNERMHRRRLDLLAIKSRQETIQQMLEIARGNVQREEERRGGGGEGKEEEESMMAWKRKVASLERQWTVAQDELDRVVESEDRMWQRRAEALRMAMGSIE